MAAPLPDDVVRAPFPGFSPEALAFLRGLRDHNERSWFEARKSLYVDEVRDPLRWMVSDVGQALRAAGSSFVRGRAMRIYRDVRFSSDKSPYRTSLGASFERAADGDPVFLYVHVEPGASFVAAGLYRATAKVLRPVRERLVADPAAFRRVAAEVEGAGLVFGSLGHELSGLPRGFATARGGPVEDVLRWESWVAQRGLTDAEVEGPGLVDVVVAAERAARPLTDYIDDARG